MIHRPLFAYGTLRDPDMLSAVLGRALPQHQRVDANAEGWTAVHYPGRVYPALHPMPGETAPGLLLYGLTTLELTILDAFEGDEYRRDTLMVHTPPVAVTADVYLPVVAIGTDAAPWTLEQWTALHKPSVLAGEQRTATALRERLSAQQRPV